MELHPYVYVVAYRTEGGLPDTPGFAHAIVWAENEFDACRRAPDLVPPTTVLNDYAFRLQLWQMVGALGSVSEHIFLNRHTAERAARLQRVALKMAGNKDTEHLHVAAVNVCQEVPWPRN